MSKSTAKSNSKGKGKQKSGSDESQSKEKPDVFVWTDDEVQLLLKVTLEYTTSKAIEIVDWESIQNKYTEILTILKERLPTKGKRLGRTTHINQKKLQKDESTDLDLEDTSVDTAILHDVTNSLSGRSKPSASKNINRLAVSSPAAGSSRAPESVDGSGSELTESFEENSGDDSVERNLEDNIPGDQNENDPST